MTNEVKSNILSHEIAQEFDSKEIVGYECALQMAEWKEQQMIEKAVEWLEPLFKDLAGYNCGGDLVEDFKKFMFEQC